MLAPGGEDVVVDGGDGLWVGSSTRGSAEPVRKPILRGKMDKPGKLCVKCGIFCQ